MEIKNTKDFDTALTDGPYVWPGGYPCYYITADGAALCPTCAEKEQELIRESIAAKSDDGWRVVGKDVNWEDSYLYCDHCNAHIESAYCADENEEVNSHETRIPIP